MCVSQDCVYGTGKKVVVNLKEHKLKDPMKKKYYSTFDQRRKKNQMKIQIFKSRN